VCSFYRIAGDIVKTYKSYNFFGWTVVIPQKEKTPPYLIDLAAMQFTTEELFNSLGPQPLESWELAMLYLHGIDK
jgi:hypothetical protein